MTKEEKDGIVIMTKGTLVSLLMEGYEDYVKDKEVHLSLIDGISLLVDEDPLFFSFSDIDGYDFKSLSYNIICDYKNKYDDNRDLCNKVTRKVNGLDIYSSKEKEDMRMAYMVEQQIDRDRKIKDLDDMFYSIMYDSAVYYSIITGEVSKLDNYDNIIDSTIYLYNNYNNLFDDEIIRNNDLYLIDNIISNSKKFSITNKYAKRLKKFILKEKLEY